VEKCIACSEVLQAPVKFCPYCGKSTAIQPVSDALVSDAVAVEATVPVSAVSAVKAEDKSGPQGKVETQAESGPAQTIAKDETGNTTRAGEATSTPGAVQKATRKDARKDTRSSSPGEQEKATQRDPVVSPPLPESKPKPTSRRKLWWILGLIVVAAVWFFSRGDGGRAQCQAAVDNGLQLLKAGKVSAAAGQTSTVQSACSGKLAAQAAPFEAELDKATRRICARPIANIRARLQANRLTSTGTLIEGLDAVCAESGEVPSLRAALAQAQNAASDAEQRAERAIDSGDSDAARQAIAELDQRDRESKSSAGLKTKLSALRARPAPDPVVSDLPATGSSTTATPTPAQAASATPVARPALVPTPAPVAKPVTKPAPDPTVAIAERFLRQAESALAQKRFDAAKTYIESAYQVDPSNSRIEPLRQRVRAEERKVLEGDTTIR